MHPLRFVTLNPGHFHAALVHRQMYADVAPQVHVYGRVGPELLAHLQRLVGFNLRTEGPTSWELEVHACPDYLERFRRDKPGDVAVLAGFNATRIDAIEAAVGEGLHVLADKPWVLVPSDLPRLERVLESAEARGLIAYDIMTERYEITSILQRELVCDQAVFGAVESGSPADPGVLMESVHYLKKTVAGAPLCRPAEFFDVHGQGEGLSDVGTHLVDLVAWILYPGDPVPPGDVCVLDARRWPTTLGNGEFAQVTGLNDFPDFLRQQLQHGRLPYYCNTRVDYTVRGVHVRLDVRWDFEAPPGAGDTHRAVFCGSRSRIEVRQGRDEGFQPEVYVLTGSATDGAHVLRALESRVAQLQTIYPGLGVSNLGSHFHVTIPAEYRAGHEAHFAQVTDQFLRYVLGRETLPAWERPNMLAKYDVTTRGVELARARWAQWNSLSAPTQANRGDPAP
jgi:predicted dehydrogenase